MDDDNKDRRDTMNRDRLKAFECTLSPEVTKFAPKVKADPSINELIENIRARVRDINVLCDELAVAVNDSEEHAKKAADSLMDLIKRVK